MKGTRTGEERQPTNAGQQDHTMAISSTRQHELQPATRLPGRSTCIRPGHYQGVAHASDQDTTHHSTTQATKVAPIDKQSTTPTEANLSQVYCSNFPIHTLHVAVLVILCLCIRDSDVVVVLGG